MWTTLDQLLRPEGSMDGILAEQNKNKIIQTFTILNSQFSAVGLKTTLMAYLHMVSEIIPIHDTKSTEVILRQYALDSSAWTLIKRKWQTNARPAFFYTKPFVYNSMAIYLTKIKLWHHPV